MKAEEYLSVLTDQMRCKMAREAVRDELLCHIEDQKAAFISEGMEKSEAEGSGSAGDGRIPLRREMRWTGSTGRRWRGNDRADHSSEHLQAMRFRERWRQR